MHYSDYTQNILKLTAQGECNECIDDVARSIFGPPGILAN